MANKNRIEFEHEVPAADLGRGIFVRYTESPDFWHNVSGGWLGSRNPHLLVELPDASKQSGGAMNEMPVRSIDKVSVDSVINAAYVALAGEQQKLSSGWKLVGYRRMRQHFPDAPHPLKSVREAMKVLEPLRVPGAF
ncbi:MAG: hypothetical protein AB7G06_05730 [Bdellovibrionales bacterium]